MVSPTTYPLKSVWPGRSSAPVYCWNSLYKLYLMCDSATSRFSFTPYFLISTSLKAVVRPRTSLQVLRSSSLYAEPQQVEQSVELVEGRLQSVIVATVRLPLCDNLCNVLAADFADVLVDICVHVDGRRWLSGPCFKDDCR